jgi:hypothetical protein
MKCDIGDAVWLRSKATNTETGEPVNPDAYYWKVVPLKGDVDDIEKPDVGMVEDGVFEAIFKPSIAGKHRALFLGSGDNQAAEEIVFEVRPPRVPRD